MIMKIMTIIKVIQNNNIINYEIKVLLKSDKNVKIQEQKRKENVR